MSEYCLKKSNDLEQLAKVVREKSKLVERNEKVKLLILSPESLLIQKTFILRFQKQW